VAAEQHLAAPPRRQLVDETGHPLLGRYRLIDHQHVVGVGGEVVLHERVRVLAGGGCGAVHPCPPPAVSRRTGAPLQPRSRPWSMPNWSSTLPLQWSRRSSMVSGEW